MKNNFLSLLFVFLLSVVSCKKDNKEKESLDFNKGSLTILTDDSFKSIAEALAEAYMINYPETKINVEVKKEDLAFLDLLEDKAKMIIMSRNLSEKELAEYDKMVKLKFQPANFAADAVAFVVPKNSERTNISVEEIKNELSSDNKNIIFDGTNSGNLNFVAQKFNKKPSELKFSIINGNENVIKELNKYPNKIGVVSLNTFSRAYSEDAQKLREMVRILPITENGKTYDITPQTLRTMEYPFTRVLYFLNNEAYFGVASGFVRFACTQLGQMVVQKEGLQPYYLFKREVQMR
ncbi:MAG: substrate-binding domain-containing protein [Cruoricaptor ignavus]|nr:substrate-binding domain-containing protein [Cruoricaptor ignavus]